MDLFDPAQARLAAGDPGAAHAAWQRALSILADLDHRDGAEVRAKLRVLPGPA